MCLLQGKGIATDAKKAVKWLEKAIEQDNAMAANNLGFCYLNGFGVEKDKEKAKYYFQKSAEMGYELAKKNLKFIK